MAAYGGSFESERTIKERREVKQRAREEAVTEARNKYEKEQKQEELRRLRGEDTWMLPEVNQQLEQLAEEHSIESKKKKKKSKKGKKEKKEKKSNKLKKKTDESSDCSSASEVEWIEAAPCSETGSGKKPWKVEEEQSTSAKQLATVQREEWMNLDFLSLKTVSQAARKANKQKEKDAEQEELQVAEQAAIHKKELNPYWKDGGTGLPPEECDSKPIQKAAMVEDGGLSWLRQSYQRMKEQAEREQRRLEDVVSERYGSMEIFQEKLQEAEKVSASNYQKGSESNWRERWRKPRNWASDQNNREYRVAREELKVKTDIQKGRDSLSERQQKKVSKINSGEKKRKSEREDIRDRFKDRSQHFDKEAVAGSSKEKYRDKSGEDDRRNREDECEQSGQRDNRARGLRRDNFQERQRDKFSSLNNLKSKFMKPCEDDGVSVGSSRWGTQAARASLQQPESCSSLSSTFRKPADDGDKMSTWCRDSKDETSQVSTLPAQDSTLPKGEGNSKCEDRRIETKPGENSPVQELSSQDQRNPVSSAASPIRSDAANEESVQPLSEEEMNKLGAKIVKAELMGNLEMASKFKAQLEAARKLKSLGEGSNIAASTAPRRIENLAADQDQDVVLIRTDRSGRAWPVSAATEFAEQQRGRKKKQTIETHSEGKRVRYFQDDDNLSLQDLVRKERMSTAEDQNERFTRMASKFMEKMDRDYYTLDDMFVSKAAKKEQSGQEDERQRHKAISEHKKLAGRMEKCHYCFDNPELPKHLIIAIGIKVYLCLPNCQSLTEGHCLIAPLQHHTAGTALDEDIWEEMQLFRKALVKMLADKGLDCVFFETNMHLKKHFHMVYECIPLPKELGDMAPIYFKKAILESDEEWTMNKKLIDLSTRDVRRAVPKGLPYFSVDFGLQGGFAHVIENEHKFPVYFGKEIIGGMLDLEPRRWRKPMRENFDDQRKKVLHFSQWWKPYNCTKTKD
ncbi:LOW QUALITY PROTEIN: CWF19-like protein 2 [Callorhinchus milii]|uniref:LOW QUALITY PROTEIN: CWF19-like protein 2 n=1 Tax=Callorhinchus milii TaxID=7868 RepID=UPI001C3F7BE0|nr:LOW QUALITY PROTEIN: CWF19-like protein 2 [Callorhinchus milii]